jgi:hypothetical protein
VGCGKLSGFGNAKPVVGALDPLLSLSAWGAQAGEEVAEGWEVTSPSGSTPIAALGVGGWINGSSGMSGDWDLH